MVDANIVYVQKQLGHSSLNVTVDRYTHWIRRTDRTMRSMWIGLWSHQLPGTVALLVAPWWTLQQKATEVPVK